MTTISATMAACGLALLTIGAREIRAALIEQGGPGTLAAGIVLGFIGVWLACIGAAKALI
jgi:hypothetical protein